MSSLQSASNFSLQNTLNRINTSKCLQYLQSSDETRAFISFTMKNYSKYDIFDHYFNVILVFFKNKIKVDYIWATYGSNKTQILANICEFE